MAVVILKHARAAKCFVLSLTVLVLVGMASSFVAAAPLGAGFERTLGNSAVSEILKQYGGEYVLPLHQRLWVEEVFRRLVGATDRKDVVYSLTILNSSELNAFALPGGYVFITRGLVNSIGYDEAKLAAVLGHEVAHIEQKHGVNAVFRQMGLTVLLEMGVMALDLATADLFRIASHTLLQLVNLGWGREAELEADLIGQTLAVKAGFDGAGAVRLLDDLFGVPSEDLPMKIFRTHPDTEVRRKRLEENLASYWSTPVVVRDQDVLERLDGGRNFPLDRRIDPTNRYVISLPLEGSGLQVFDQQTSRISVWLEDVLVQDFAWSPRGKYLAVLVSDEPQTQLWICDRWGRVTREVRIELAIADMCWSPQGNQVAMSVYGPSGEHVLVTYVDADIIFAVGEGLSGGVAWLDSGVYFENEGKWYHASAPKVEGVTIPNPVPQVLQKQRILSPSVVREGTTIRLTRPSLTMP